MATTNAKLYKIPTGDLSDSYVDLKTAQAVGGVKNFTNGIKLNSSVILNSVDTAGSANSVATTQWVAHYTSDWYHEKYPYGFTNAFFTTTGWGYAQNNTINPIVEWTTENNASVVCFENPSKALSMQIDGYFYCNEGNYRCTYVTPNSSVGATNKGVYVNSNGQIQALSANYGNSYNPVYMSSGAIVRCSATRGSVNYPIYMSNGYLFATSSTNPMMTMKGTGSSDTKVFETVLTPSNNSITISNYTYGAVLYLRLMYSKGNDYNWCCDLSPVMVAPFSKLNTSMVPTIGDKVLAINVCGFDYGSWEGVVLFIVRFYQTEDNKLKIQAVQKYVLNSDTQTEITDYTIYAQLITSNQ